MPDRDKVIKGLMGLHGPKETMSIIADAIALLLEQETVEPTRQHIEKPNLDQWYCGECGKWIGKTFAYCPWCGREVKWE